jgi:hypothetical protein
MSGVSARRRLSQQAVCVSRNSRARARSLAIELALLAEFWDYADPFPVDPLPAFPAERQI